MHQVAFLLFDRFQLLDVCGPLQVFASTNEELRLAGAPALYETRLCALQAGPQQSSSGVVLQAGALPRRGGKPLGTVIVPGGPGAWDPLSPQAPSCTEPLAHWLQRHAGHIPRLASVCTGAFVLARSGLLAQRSAVTHWAACGALREAFPEIDVQSDAIYFRDGPYWTSAGVTAGIDMALGMVEADAGHDVAMNVAKKLVVFYKRPGGQSQFSSALLEQSAGDERIEQLHQWIGAHLRETVDVPRLAEQLAMTPRTFARFYLARTGMTPARAVEQIRLERACRLIESHHQTVKAIALQCGFSSEEVMRRSFVRHLRVSPMEYRQRFCSPPPSPG